ncbi:DUF4268 domain-containing protein, partial [bacterium]|nr:DUF4268 domain-containing protein [bacterium]
MKLGKLKKIPLQKYWKHETDFTKWLSEKENIELLSDEIGIDDIEDIQTEAYAGSFRVDILAKESHSD